MIQCTTVGAEWHKFDSVLNEALKKIQERERKVVSIKFVEKNHAKIVHADKDDDVSDYIGD